MNIETVGKRKLIVATLVIAFALRFAWGVSLDPHQLYFPDSRQWNGIALHFLSGHGLTTDEGARALRPPAYSLFLSLVYFIFGKENLLAVRIVQALISSCTCLIVYLLGKRLFTVTAAKIAMAACAAYPFFIYYSGAVLTETLFMFILSLIMLALAGRRFAWAGVLFGLGILCRSELVVFFLFALAGTFVVLRKKEALRKTVIMAAITGALLLPWMLRNYLVFHAFVPLTTMSGYTFYEGNSPHNPTGGPGGALPFPDTRGMSEIEKDRFLRHEAIRTIRENPRRMIPADGEQIQTPLERQAEYGQPGVRIEADRSRERDQLHAAADSLRYRPRRFLETETRACLSVSPGSLYDSDQSRLRIFAAIPPAARAFHDRRRKLRADRRHATRRRAANGKYALTRCAAIFNMHSVSSIKRRRSVMRTIITIILLTVMIAGVHQSCGMSKTAEGAAIGAMAGAAVGGIIGKQTGNTAAGAIIGGAVGGAAGAYIGNYMDKQAEEIQADLEGAKVERIGEGIKITFDSGILFDVNKATLRPEAKANLDKLAVILNKYADTNILIEGHTDATGADEYNLELSRNRASSVSNYLAGLAVDSTRFTTMGYGESQPIATNDTDGGRQQNRRVEIAIMANDKLKKAAEEKTAG